MSFLFLAQQRCSCREYLIQPIPKEVIMRCIEAARLAPSACNSQPWRFVVVTDPDLRHKIATAAFSGMFSMNAFAKQAPVLVVVVRERAKYAARLGGVLRGVQYSLIDLGIACDHFTLQAAEEGLGTCWLGWFSERAVKKALKIPRNQKVDVILSLGYPAEGHCVQRVKDRKAASDISEFR